MYIILTFAHLGGWLAASQICFKVTARCSYELYCQLLFYLVTARCSLSQRPKFHPCSSSSVVRASDFITEGRGFKFHLGLGLLLKIESSKMRRKTIAWELATREFSFATFLWMWHWVTFREMADKGLGRLSRPGAAEPPYNLSNDNSDGNENLTNLHSFAHNIFARLARAFFTLVFHF